LLWIIKAEEHLLAARVLREGQGPSGTACFLCQQAAENGLKALLVARGVTPPRTHNLVDLWRRLPEDARPAGIPSEALAGWTLYAVAPRYPGFGDSQADADLGEMLEGAAHLVAAARATVEGLP